MNEMIERVARAIFDTTHHGGFDWNKATTANHNQYHRYARAAIAAMREPTIKEMYGANWGEYDRSYNEDGTPAGITLQEQYPDESWQAMIDEILKDKT